MSDLSQRIANLSLEKRALFELRIMKKGTAFAKEPEIARRDASDPCAISFAQQRLWFLDRLEPGSPVYNIPAAVRLTGLINVTALEQSLNEIVQRHEALRTSFSALQGEPMQMITPTLCLTLPITDLQELPAAEREAEARRLATQEARRPFDLAQGPLLRAVLLRLGEKDHALLLTMHHIVSDGWSMGVLFRELSVLYGAFSTGRPSALPELAIQYADFAVWQRQWLQGEVLEEQLEYWKKQLDAAPPLLELPSDRPRPAVQTFQGASRSMMLGKTLSEALGAFSRQEGVTLYMTLLTAFQTLLYRYTGQDDIVVGSPIAGRNRVEIEELIGFFVNTLVLRTDLSGNPTFRQLLGRVREVCLGAYAHQDLPFEKLVEELQPERNLSYSPLFQAVFAFQNTPGHEMELAGLRLRPLVADNETAKFDLTLFMEEATEGLKGTLEYNTDLFDASTIERMVGHYQTLLEGIVANPDRRIGMLPLLSESEQHQLLVEWNDTRTDYPREKCIHELFEAQVERTPDATALVFEDRQMTYGELNRRANQLAHHLQSLGVKPEVLVGVCMERSLEMIVGLLSVLKAGGAYVPLDPNYPAERLSFMLQDTGVPVLLTQKRLLEGLPECGAKVICLDSDWALIGKESAENLGSLATAGNLAYVMYTSGSTGMPKGVSINHRGVVRLVKGAGYANLSSEEIFLQLAPISFDASTFEIWGPLLNGGQLAIMANTMPSIEEIGQTIQRQKVTTLWLTAGLFSLMVEEQPDYFKPVRQLLAGGDVLSVPHVRKFLRQLKNCKLINGYGPTENTTFTCCYPIEGHNHISISVPIGRPISNTHVYILDRHLQPLPVGVAGELHIGGDGLARGYLNRPQLTSEKFIPHPFSDDPSARLYKTGDLVRYLSDGNIEFMGRIDHQIKIRGFRIELGEIEVVLAGYSGVNMAVVVAREDRPGDTRLVAYVVPKVGQELSVRNLRGFLKQKLPDYMVPSAFVVLESLPLTPNGKVDRLRLPAPDRTRPEPEETYVAPRTPVEDILAAIWSKVLNLEKVGIYDNFFELGGHSLLATQVISRVIKTFKIKLPLRSLFQAPTVADMAVVFDQNQFERRTKKGTAIVKEPEIARRDASDPCAVSFAQQRLWFLDQFEPANPVYNIPATVRLSGLLDVIALEQSLNEIVQRHEALRTSFSALQGEPMQMITPTLCLTLPITDLQELPAAEREAEARRLATQEARCPFDLAQGPLLRAALLRLGEKDHVLLLTMHHIVSDGWSMGVLFRELSVLYGAFSTGSPSALPELAIQYADFAVWQRQWLQGEILEEQLEYWKKQLDAAPPLLELPVDRPRPAIQRFQGASRSMMLTKTLSEALGAFSRQEGVTLYMTLLTAFQTLLYRYTGQDDIVVGSPIAGRNRVEIEGLIGFFVNTLVLRTDLSGNPTFRQLLGRVREVCLGAYAHQDLPFEKLVEELQPERNLSYSPLFQVMFILQNAPRRALQLPGLTVDPLEVDSGTAKFDLTLSVVEDPAGLHVTLEYDTALFDPSTINRMVDHLQTLLEGIVADPEQRLSELPLLTAAERHQLLVEWNDTQADYPRDKCIHHLFEEQVVRSPDATALVFEDRQMTYWELNRRANQLAHHLQSLGVKPEVLVGICMQRSLEMIVGLLGILKAGGAYVPLDPVYPEKRLASILQDSEVPILLTHSRTDKCLPESTARILNFDLEGNALSRERKDNPISGAEDDQPAYIIYTSGSTGKPKGVIGLHRGAVNRFRWMWKNYPFKTDEICCQKTALSFVDSIWEIFGPLLQGIPTVIIPEDIVRDPQGLIKVLASHSVTRIVLVPSFLRVLLDTVADLQIHLPKLKLWITSGEELSAELAQQFHENLPQSMLLNLYGSSEVSADCTWYETKKGRLSPRVPIGRPISNTQIYLLDSNLQLLPIGIPGEIHVGGAGLAKGYLKQPELTKNRFIRNPFLPERVLYKTGDLARYRSDGNLEFLGRIDHQVKIRGYRIELREIEFVLNQHPKIRENVVIVHEDFPGDGRLVAYLVVKKNDLQSENGLRNFLKKRLPDYMVPSDFVFIDTLPLAPNGKIDRKALTGREWNSPRQEENYAAPHDMLELQLTRVWEKVLNRKPIGTRDNFFEIGGHSLLAVRLFAFIEKIIGQRLPLTTLFKAPTIKQLANILRDDDWSVPWTSLVPIKSTGSRFPFYCVHGAGGAVLELYPLASHLPPDQPFFGLQDSGIEGGSIDELTFEEMASHYIQEMCSVQSEGPYIIGGYCFGASVAYEMARQLEAHGEEVAGLIIIEGRYRGEKESGPASVSTRLRRFINYVINRICLEKSNLSVRESNEKLAHIRSRARRAIEKSWINILIAIDPFLSGFNLRSRHSLPYKVEVLYKLHIKALRNYEAKPYSGRVIIFKAMQKSFGISSDPYLGWGRLINRESEVCEVPGLHENIINEPWVKVLAEKLNDSLERLNHGR